MKKICTLIFLIAVMAVGTSQGQFAAKFNELLQVTLSYDNLLPLMVDNNYYPDGAIFIYMNNEFVKNATNFGENKILLEGWDKGGTHLFDIGNVGVYAFGSPIEFGGYTDDKVDTVCIIDRIKWHSDNTQVFLRITSLQDVVARKKRKARYGQFMITLLDDSGVLRVSNLHDKK